MNSMKNKASWVNYESTIATLPHPKWCFLGNPPKLVLVLSLIKIQQLYYVQLPGCREFQDLQATNAMNWGSHWIDQEVVVAEQLVILGAGLDTRAYRLPALTNVPVFEVDFQEVLEAKARFQKYDGFGTLWKVMSNCMILRVRVL